MSWWCRRSHEGLYSFALKLPLLNFEVLCACITLKDSSHSLRMAGVITSRLSRRLNRRSLQDFPAKPDRSLLNIKMDEDDVEMMTNASPSTGFGSTDGSGSSPTPSSRKPTYILRKVSAFVEGETHSTE